MTESQKGLVFVRIAGLLVSVIIVVCLRHMHRQYIQSELYRKSDA